MKYFNYNFDLNLINERNINKVKNNKKINIIDVNHKFKRIFEKNLAIQITILKIHLEFRLNYYKKTKLVV